MGRQIPGEPLTEIYSGGKLGGLAVTNSFDNYLRRVTVAVTNGSSTLQAATYSYDNASRLLTVTDTVATAYSVAYGYAANSMLVTNLTFKQNGNSRLVTSKSFDVLNRLTSISSQASGSNAPALPISLSYLYNQANQRTRADLEDGSYWIYQYDDRGQVTSGRRYWADGTQVEGQQFEYAFDDIGNRMTTGGRASAAGRYTANRLNQYSQRTVAPYADILGIANPSATVTVNGNNPDRKGEYFAWPLSINNSSAAQYPTVSVLSTYGATITNTGKIFVPKTPEQFTYDADGNLLSDGRWTNSWDGENRLVQMLRDTDSPSGAREKLVFEYDHLSRRIRKQVYLWTGSAYALTNDIKFVYDGWNLEAELNATNNTVIEGYVWGLDLSGTQRAASGVGGLLKLTDYTGGTTHHFVAYDGNGNVAALVDGSSGALSAKYEYSPFGEAIRSSGTMARRNPIRFSTIFADNESGLAYFGYRYYNPITGRWLSNDPLEEDGGPNLRAFLENDAVDSADPAGLRPWGTCLRQALFGDIKDNNNVDSLFDLGLNSVLNSKDVTFTGPMLKAIQEDPDLKRLESEIVARAHELAGAAARNGMGEQCAKIEFSGFQVVTFGGAASSEPKWQQFWYSARHPIGTFSKYSDTWGVAGNKLTWALRHANVDYVVTGVVCPVCGCGVCGDFSIHYTVTDKLDLRPHHGGYHNPFTKDPYDFITAITGTLYHDVLGATDTLQTHASWTRDFQLCQ